MFSPDKIFGNHFDSRNITNTRIANFAEDCLNRFKGIAIEGQFADVITQLSIAVNNLREELGAVNTSKDTRKTKTLRVDEFIDSFKDKMSELEGAVAYTTGGFNSDTYHAFYPNGVTEYRNATKTTMAELMIRIKNALTTYTATLDEELADQLNVFYTQWHTLRNQQETLKSKVSDNRTQRTDAREAVELALNTAIGTLILEFPFDVEKCGRFFDFNMLLPVPHHHEEEEEEEEVVETPAS